MKIAVVGAGGVGGYFGGRLAEAGADVTFIARGAHLQAMARGGLRVDSPAGGLSVPVQATDDPATVGEVDAVLVAVKTWQVAEAAETMRPMVGPGTFVVPLLNGVDAPAELAAVLGAGPVGGGLCGIFSHLSGPGHVCHVGASPFIRLGELDNRRSPRAERLAAALDRCTGVAAEIAPDIEAAMWQKFLFIAPTSAVGAAAAVPWGVLRSLEPLCGLVTAAMEEVWAVGRAHGVAWPADALAIGRTMLEGSPAAGISSMQRDIEAGRPSELDAQVGAVVRLGRAHGVETPISDALYRVLMPREQRSRGLIDF